jgi:hypothetical protein
MNSRVVASLVLLGVLCGAAYWVLSPAYGPSARSNAPPVEEIQGLRATLRDLDLGEVWEAKEFRCVLPVENVTRTEISVLDFSTSCSCATVHPRKLIVKPGESAKLELTIDLAERQPAQIGLAERPFAVQIIPILERNYQGPGWVLHGTIKAPVTLDTLGVHFGDEPIYRQNPAAQRSVVATVHVPFKTLELTVDNKSVVATISKTADPQRFSVIMGPAPTTPPGAFASSVHFDVTSADGKRLPRVSLRVDGCVQQEIRAIPSRLFLPAVPWAKQVKRP